MAADESKVHKERSRTDESLRAERENVDGALGELTTIEETADAVVERARSLADDVLTTARAKADAETLTEAHDIATQTERDIEDRALKVARDAADDALTRERAAQAARLSFERDETDKDLSTERSRYDGVLATRDEFLGIVSHDLRNLLGAVVGFAALMETGASGGENRERLVTYAQRIQRAGGRMDRLIGDLVDVASIEAGKLAVTRRLVDPTHVFLEAVETLQARAATAKVSLSAEIAAPLPLVELDAARILQVLTNLLGNAIKFTPPHGQIVLQASASDDSIRVDVHDTGVGIRREHLDAIFQRFIQVNENDRRGVGLGLYIAKCIVEAHGGAISTESVISEGSTFTITLPITSAEAPALGRLEEGPVALGSA